MSSSSMVECLPPKQVVVSSSLTWTDIHIFLFLDHIETYQKPSFGKTPKDPYLFCRLNP